MVALPAHSVSRRCTPDLAFQLGEPEKRIAPPLGDDLGIAHADLLGTADVLAQLRRMEDEPAAVVVEDDLFAVDPQGAMDDMGILGRLPGARPRRGTHGHEPVLERKYHARKGVGARWGGTRSAAGACR